MEQSFFCNKSMKDRFTNYILDLDDYFMIIKMTLSRMFTMLRSLLQ